MPLASRSGAPAARLWPAAGSDAPRAPVPYPVAALAELLPTPDVQRALRDRLVAWYRGHRRDLPWRRTRDPYAIWVSELMLQQTRVEAVEGYWVRFLRRFPTVEALAAASEEDVLAAWSGLGYYRRARALHAAAKEVVALHGGVFPRTRDGLRALPGVGPYTAGAVLSIAFDEPEPLVDGNVERVFARLFELPGARGSRELAAACWAIAEALVPDRPSAASTPRRGAAAPSPGEWNQALMELGATVCTPKTPACGVCPVAVLCRGRASGRALELPPPRPTPAPVDVTLEAYLVPAAVVAGPRPAPWPAHWPAYWFEQRSAEGRMGGLWQLPTIELRAAPTAPVHLFPDALAAGPGSTLRPGRALFTLRHAITHHRIRLHVRAAELAGDPPPEWRALTADEARTLPLSGMARKVLARLDSSRGALFAEGEGA